MPVHDDRAADAQDNKRWLLGFGLAVLLCANLALIAVLAVGAWRDFYLPILDIVPAGATADFRTWFETYRDRVDSLNRLVTALIGLSALYSVVIGITAYLSAQFYVDRFKEALKEAKEALKEFQQLFPSFKEMNASVSKIIEALAKAVPDVERLSEIEEGLEPQFVELVQHHERCVAFFEFLKDDAAPELREVYRRLGRFYRALYDREKKRLKDCGNPLMRPRKPSLQCSPEETMAYRLLDRAEFYIDHLLKKDPGNFAALNEMAILFQEIDGSGRPLRAKQYFQESIARESRQQRAFYSLGLIQMAEADAAAGEERAKWYADAEKTFTLALSTDVWEHQKSSPERKADLYYNRACVRSLLGQAALEEPGAANAKSAEAWAEKAVEDLFLCSKVPSADLLKNLLADSKPGKDLAWLDRLKNGELLIVRKRLGDAIPPESADSVVGGTSVGPSE